MGENFWTVERLTELRRPLEAKAETVEGEDYQLIRIKEGLSKYVWNWLHDNNSSLRLTLSEINPGLTMLVKMRVISPQLTRSGPERFHRRFFPQAKIDEKTVAKAYMSLGGRS